MNALDEGTPRRDSRHLVVATTTGIKDGDDDPDGVAGDADAARRWVQWQSDGVNAALLVGINCVGERPPRRPEAETRQVPLVKRSGAD